MKKGKEWLKGKIEDEYLESAGVFGVSGWETTFEELSITKKELFSLIDQLDEPEKVVVPQFVADWIEECREMDVRLGESFNTHYEDNREIHTWIYNSDDKNSEIYGRAWLDGYTVEKEPQWVVKTGKNWFFKNFESVGEYNYQAIGTGSIEEAKKFKDKLEAESVALLSDGEVEEVTK